MSFNKSILFLFFCLTHFVLIFTTVLNKVFFHRGNQKDKLVFYFNDNPKVNLLSPKKVTKNGLVNLVFLLPKIKITKEADVMISEINRIKNDLYKLQISQKLNDLEFKITYDTKKVLDLKISSFPAITSSKGITFNILHKPVSSKISKKKILLLIWDTEELIKVQLEFQGSKKKI